MPKAVLKNTGHDIGSFLDRFRAQVLDPLYRDREGREAAEYVLTELLNNAQEHGNRFDADKRLTVCWKHFGGGLVLSVQDEGECFTPVIPKAPPPVTKPRGRGLWSVAREARKIKFHSKRNKVSVLLEVDND